MCAMDWNAAWRCLVHPIIHVGGSRSAWHYYNTSGIMTCVNVNSDMRYLKTNPPLSWCVPWHDNGLCWRIRQSAICICFRSIYQSLVQPALDGCDSVLVQIKFHKMETDGASRPVWRRVGLFGDGRREKKSFFALWWMKNKSADLTPMIPLPTHHTLVFFFSLPFHGLCSGVRHSMILHSWSCLLNVYSIKKGLGSDRWRNVRSCHFVSVK